MNRNFVNARLPGAREILLAAARVDRVAITIASERNHGDRVVADLNGDYARFVISSFVTCSPRPVALSSSPLSLSLQTGRIGVFEQLPRLTLFILLFPKFRAHRPFHGYNLW